MEHPIGSLMDTTMEKIKEMIDVNTIIGEPITSPDGTLIIPVSKCIQRYGKTVPLGLEEFLIRSITQLQLCGTDREIFYRGVGISFFL